MTLAPAQRLRVVVAGMIGQFPLGGLAWDYFHYVLGLDQLGHEVCYHEQTGAWPFDPVRQSCVESPAYSVELISDFFARHAPHLSGRWHYVSPGGASHGMTRAAFDAFAATADVFLNVSGGNPIPPALRGGCRTVFVDTDPGYTQIRLVSRPAWSPNVDAWAAGVAAHDVHLTYALNIGAADCGVPTAGLAWRTTRPLVTPLPWRTARASPPAEGAAFGTVMTCDDFPGPLRLGGSEFFGKMPEFEPFVDLPRRSGLPLAVAAGGVKCPVGRLRTAGWTVTDAHHDCRTPDDYVGYVGRCAGEFSVAKHVYVALRSGWFSTRTACFLAAGRPAVVQETGWSSHIPAGDGLFAFAAVEEAIEGLRRAAADPPRAKAAAAEIAREHFAADRVLPRLLDDAFASPTNQPQMHTDAHR